MVNNKVLKKNRVFGISNELDELLKLYSQRMEISLSKFVRLSITEKVKHLRMEEEKFWNELPADKLNEILLSLTDYLNEKLSGDEPQICEHSSIWKKLKNYKTK